MGFGVPSGPMASRKLFKQFHPEGTEDIEEWREQFVDTLDPTEYTGAIKLLGSWEEWKKFKKSWQVFERDILPSWLDEINIKIKSQIVEAVKKKALEGDVNASKALLQLIEMPIKDGRGRKPKAEKADKDVARVLEYLEGSSESV